MIDIDGVKKLICDGRQFSQTADGFTVLSDALMPSGALIRVHFQWRMDHLYGHDNGAAFDELARHGGTIKSLVALNKMLSETNFRVSDDGLIWRDKMPVDSVFDMISLVSDASVRAAHFLIGHALQPKRAPLNARLKDVMRVKFPEGRADPHFRGKHRQHKFDFELRENDKIFLMQSVNPDQQSIAAAIVKGIDVREAKGSNVIPIFVFDQSDDWKGESLNLLSFGGNSYDIDAVEKGFFRSAA